MELRHLRYFVAVAEELHFQRAAKRLHIEQSPLSRAIKDLEHQLGVKLLERTTRCTAMTAAGQAFLHEARRILAAVEQAQSAIKSTVLGYSRQLKIAMTPGVSYHRLSVLIAQQRKLIEDLDIRLYEMDLKRLQEAVLSQEIDVGLSLSPIDDPRIECASLWHDSVRVLLPEEHRLTQYDTLHISDLVRYPLILPAARGPNSVNSHLSRLLKSTGDKPLVIQHTDSFTLTQALVAAGVGIGFATSAQLMGYEQKRVVIRECQGQTPTLITYLMHHAQALPDVVLPFLKLLEDEETLSEEIVRQQRLSLE